MKKINSKKADKEPFIRRSSTRIECPNCDCEIIFTHNQIRNLFWASNMNYKICYRKKKKKDK